jgi:hypothetical protein
MATVADSSITLDKLPDELILEIKDYLTFPSLGHVVFVSKQLHAIALLNFYSWFPGYNLSRFLRSITLPPPAGRAIGVKTANWHCGPSASAAPALLRPQPGTRRANQMPWISTYLHLIGGPSLVHTNNSCLLLHRKIKRHSIPISPVM